MDRIVKSALPDEWLDDLTKKQIVIRGRGGVGKTVILLQMAYRAFDNAGSRAKPCLKAACKGLFACLYYDGTPYTLLRTCKFCSAV